MTAVETKKSPEFKQVLMIRYPSKFRDFMNRTRGRFLRDAGVSLGIESETPSPHEQVPAPAKEIIEDPIPFLSPSELTRRRQVMLDKRAAMGTSTETAQPVNGPAETEVHSVNTAELSSVSSHGLARRVPGSTNVAAEFSHTNSAAQPEGKVINGNFPLQAAVTAPKSGRHMKPSPLDTSFPFDSSHETTPIGDAVGKKFNEIEMRQQALQSAQASANRIVADRGAEAAALSYAIKSGYEQNPNILQ